MNASSSAASTQYALDSRLPVLQLLNPGKLTIRVILSVLVGVGLARLSYLLWATPLWMSTAIVLVSLLPIGIVKWRQDKSRYGLVIMVISILLVAQGTHTIEHLAQWVEYHILFFTPRQATGLLSPANSEWVHFIWNWVVLLVVIWLVVKGGLRNFFSFMLLGVAMGHTAEHTYLFIRYINVLSDLQALCVCVVNVSAQGLPGFFGRDGWLARSSLTAGTPLGSIPGLTTAIRLDVHFWWNVIEMSLTLIATHFYFRELFHPKTVKAELPLPVPVS